MPPAPHTVLTIGASCPPTSLRRRHVAALEEHHGTCVGIVDAASEALQTLRDLETKHTEVSARAHHLHDRCNRLAAEQVRSNRAAVAMMHPTWLWVRSPQRLTPPLLTVWVALAGPDEASLDG